jgi:signal transduction histidine kinase
MMPRISFPEDVWIGGDKLEGILWKAKEAIQGKESVCFEILPKTKILIDAAVIFLSVMNQLSADGKSVTIDFQDENSEVMGYFNRMGFFDHLKDRVAILPAKPSYSGAQLYNNSNKGLVEIVRIDDDDQKLPGRLADALETKDKKLGKASFTIFAELIDNVIRHSSTKLDAFAALQTYKNGIMVIVSDSGKGMLETLRPKLPKKYKDVSDIDIMIDAFEKGLTRHRKKSGHGCGLTTCARKAKQFHGKLHVRLADTRVNLVPADDVYTHDTAYCFLELLPIKGTHITFDFKC